MTKGLKGNPEDNRESGEFKVHYHLNGGMHRMDAVVRNRAEGELLALLKEVGAALDLPLHIETHAYGEGGLIEYLNLMFQGKEQITFAIAMLTPLLGSSLLLRQVQTIKATNCAQRVKFKKTQG